VLGRRADDDLEALRFAPETEDHGGELDRLRPGPDDDNDAERFRHPVARACVEVPLAMAIVGQTPMLS
jgi:hypothetical protein